MDEPAPQEGATGRRVRSLGVPAEGELEVFDLEEPAPGPEQCWVDTRNSGLSAGTELSFLKGTNPYLHARWDAERGVFRPGEPSASYPVRRLGYMEVGRVAESRSPAVRPGDVVAMATATPPGTAPTRGSRS